MIPDHQSARSPGSPGRLSTGQAVGNAAGAITAGPLISAAGAAAALAVRPAAAVLSAFAARALRPGDGHFRG
jgi:hypothetical protein